MKWKKTSYLLAGAVSSVLAIASYAMINPSFNLQELYPIKQQIEDRRTYNYRQHTSNNSVYGRGAPELGNPYISFLPQEAKSDFVFWNQYMREQSERRAELKARQTSDNFTNLIAVTDAEPNDTITDAQFITGFGTGTGDDPVVTISGQLSPPDVAPPVVVPTFPEDDGDINKASVTNVTIGTSITTIGTIGDGPFGSTSGDFDFYEIANVQANERIYVSIPTDAATLDWVAYIYNSSGSQVLFHDGINVKNFSYTASQNDNYYVMVTSYQNALSDAFDSSSGNGINGSQGNYDITLSLLAEGQTINDRDIYSFDAEAGDVIGLAASGAATFVEVVDSDGNTVLGSSQNISSIHPASSPLPGSGNAVLAYIAPTTGRYNVSIGSTSAINGSYTADLQIFRPSFENSAGGDNTHQILFVDFDGASFNAVEAFGRGNNPAVISPLSSFLSNWGLLPSDENAVIDAILHKFEETVRDDLAALGNNPRFSVEILNSRDHSDPFGAENVSRVIIGGTINELGISTLGIAESIDPGNFDTSETGIVLLDLLSAASSNPNSLNGIQIDPSATIIGLIGDAVGNIAAHEAGHFLGNFHTDQFNSMANIMDQGGNLANTIGLGADNIFGTADDVHVHFITDFYVANEGFLGYEDTLNRTAFGLTSAANPPTISAIGSQSEAHDQVIGPISFQINDADTDVNSLVLSVESTNTDLIPLGNILLEGTGSNRSVTVTPSASMIGESDITITISDGTLSDSSTFTVEITNSAPTVDSVIENQTISHGQTTPSIGFTISDLDDAVDTLSVTAVSSDTTLIPLANIVLGGNGSDRNITVTPAAGLVGTATITITVSDGIESVDTSFNINVINSAPTIAPVDDIEIVNGRSTNPINLSLVDNDGDILDITLASSDTNVIPTDSLFLDGTGNDKNLSIAANAAVGSSTVTITVSDGIEESSTSFIVTVTPRPVEDDDEDSGGGGGSTSLLFSMLLLGLVAARRRFKK
jgi:hypothetical protein